MVVLCKMATVTGRYTASERHDCSVAQAGEVVAKTAATYQV